MKELKERLTKLEKTVSLLVELAQSSHITVKAVAVKVDENFSKVEERFDKVDANTLKIDDRLSKVEASLNILAADTSSNFIGVDVKLDSIAEELSKINTTTRYEEEFQNLKIASR